MAVVSVKELFPGRRDSDGIERKFRHTRVFEVLTDDPNDDGYTAGAGSGIPRNGDAHPSNPFALMIEISATNSDETPYLWTVICEYSTDLPKSQSQEAGGFDSTGGSQEGGQGSSAGTPGNPLARDDDPTNRPTKWSTRTEKAQVVVNKSIVGKTPDVYDAGVEWNWGQAICNTAGYPFDPPVMKNESYTVITAVKNYPIGHTMLSLDTHELYRDHVNGVVWYGREVGTVLLDTIDMDFDIENSVKFGRLTFCFLYKPFKRDAGNIIDGGWNVRPLDAGYYETDFANLISFEMDVPEGSGKSPTEPQLLDGTGFRKAVGDLPVFLEFGVYDDADFNDLGL